MPALQLVFLCFLWKTVLAHPASVARCNITEDDIRKITIPLGIFIQVYQREGFGGPKDPMVHYVPWFPDIVEIEKLKSTTCKTLRMREMCSDPNNKQEDCFYTIIVKRFGSDIQKLNVLLHQMKNSPTQAWDHTKSNKIKIHLNLLLQEVEAEIKDMTKLLDEGHQFMDESLLLPIFNSYQEILEAWEKLFAKSLSCFRIIQKGICA